MDQPSALLKQLKIYQHKSSVVRSINVNIRAKAVGATVKNKIIRIDTQLRVPLGKDVVPS